MKRRTLRTLNVLLGAGLLAFVALSQRETIRQRLFRRDIGDTTWTLAFEQITLEGEQGAFVHLRFIPGTHEFLALQKTGRVVHFKLDDDRARPLTSFHVQGVHDAWDCGLVAAAFDPDYENNHFVYFSRCTGIDSGGIARLTFDPADPLATQKSQREIIRLHAPGSVYSMHNFGALGFDAEGNLWAVIGDKTAPPEHPRNSVGSLIRIVPNRDPVGAGYTPARGNPFPDHPRNAREIYAWGFRSPWTAALDRRGRFWVADVGSKYEEINLVTEAGQDFGSPEEEGAHTELLRGTRAPFVYWDRSPQHAFVKADPQARAQPGTDPHVAWVGSPYRDEGSDRYAGRLTDRILFSDICVGWIRALEVDGDGAVLFHRHVGHLPYLGGIDQARDGYLYAITLGGCRTSDLNRSRMVRLVVQEPVRSRL